MDIFLQEAKRHLMFEHLALPGISFQFVSVFSCRSYNNWMAKFSTKKNRWLEECAKRLDEFIMGWVYLTYLLMHLHLLDFPCVLLCFFVRLFSLGFGVFCAVFFVYYFVLFLFYFLFDCMNRQWLYLWFRARARGSAGAPRLQWMTIAATAGAGPSSGGGAAAAP